ncbi:hypothetical protein DIURU_000406 [Diutina rugosa]|uniref:Cytochrome P450 n=1 Tax=Diutina rugosa TaxID=5481 RepID=A0A642UY75_DIURU|nr:uncharacterized protein DIURU_000406 [Diutina rugosa]KAA8907719.1 hypothetical protein DIURU_000406 [Diutina rugosa]
MLLWGLLFVVALIAAKIVIGRLVFARKERQAGCSPFKFHKSDGVWGFANLVPILKAKKEGRILSFNRRYLYGDDRWPHQKTFTIFLGGNFAVATRDPENIKAVLATNFSHYQFGQRKQMLSPLLGDGIFTLDGEGWKHSRTMLRPQFAREQVAHVQMLEPHVQRLVRQIYARQGEVFDLQELFFRLTVDSATEFLFGESVESLSDGVIGQARSPEEVAAFPERENFSYAFDLSQDYLSQRVALQGAYFLKDGREFRQLNDEVHRFSDYYVNKALAMSPADLDLASRHGYVFLYELAKNCRDPKVLRDQALNILLAGRDTTAGLLSFVFMELARHPDLWQKLRDEVHHRFGDSLEDITFESMKKCEYLQAVISETLRMYPSVPKSFKVAVQDTTLPRGGGADGNDPMFVPKGTTLMYSVHAMHMDPDIYGKDADEFKPERWFDPQMKKMGWAYLPFNGGPRICLGQQFALTEASYVLVRLLQTFETLGGPGAHEYPPLVRSNLTICLLNGCPVAFA